METTELEFCNLSGLWIYVPLLYVRIKNYKLPRHRNHSPIPLRNGNCNDIWYCICLALIFFYWYFIWNSIKKKYTLGKRQTTHNICLQTCWCISTGIHLDTQPWGGSLFLLWEILTLWDVNLFLIFFTKDVPKNELVCLGDFV